MEQTHQLEYRRKVILVVEDDEAVGEFIVMALHLENAYRALRLTNAAEALSTVGTLRPDLCVLDYRLPGGMTGLELADRLHQMDTFRRLPLILMSANAPAHVKECKDLMFLEKPFSLDELLAVVSRLFDPKPF